MKKAFTLIEVNLAMLIMAGGILSIVGLYAFGFREGRQGRDDVAVSAVADAFLGPLAMAIASTNVDWQDFRELDDFPTDGKGWGSYIDANSGLVETDPKGRAAGLSSWLNGLKLTGDDKPDLNKAQAVAENMGLSYGIVVRHDRDSPVVSIGFRAVDKNKYGTIMSMPLFFTEVRFQGRSDK